MNEILDKELRITLMNNKLYPNTYYLTYQNYNKCTIDTLYEGNNMIILPIPREDCTAEELCTIIDRFSKFIFELKPELSGMLLKAEENLLLENIGFKLLSEDSDYLYKKNKTKDKER